MPVNPSRQFSRRAGIKWALGVAAGSALAMRSRAETASRTAAILRAPRAVVWSEFLGLNTQFMLYPPNVRERQIAALKALGLKWVRVGLHWMLLEPKQGEWKFEMADISLGLVKQHGLRAVTTVVGTPGDASSAPFLSRYTDKYPPKDPARLAQSMVTLVKRYPQVEAWQVWNEPNIPGFWYPKADPEGYGRLLATSVAAIRAAAPDKVIVMAGMAYYSQMPGREGLMLEAMGKLGAFGMNLVAAYHPYTPTAEGSDATSRDFLQHAPFINKWLRAAGARQIWATEWGWSSYAGPKEEQPIIGEAGQAEYTLKRLALMAALDYDRIFLFTLADIDERAGVRDRRYGLLTEAGEPKPVYRALASFLATTGPRLEPQTPPRLDGTPPASLISIGWRRPDGTGVWMFWSERPMTLRLSDLAKATLHQPLTGSSRELIGKGGVEVPVTTQLQILTYPAPVAS